MESQRCYWWVRLLATFALRPRSILKRTEQILPRHRPLLTPTESNTSTKIRGGCSSVSGRSAWPRPLVVADPHHLFHSGLRRPTAPAGLAYTTKPNSNTQEAAPSAHVSTRTAVARRGENPLQSFLRFAFSTRPAFLSAFSHPLRPGRPVCVCSGYTLQLLIAWLHSRACVRR